MKKNTLGLLQSIYVKQQHTLLSFVRPKLVVKVNRIKGGSLFPFFTAVCKQQPLTPWKAALKHLNSVIATAHM